jgi:hypothetical protein
MKARNVNSFIFPPLFLIGTTGEKVTPFLFDPQGGNATSYPRALVLPALIKMPKKPEFAE